MKGGGLVEVGVRGGVNGKEMKNKRGEESEVREKRKRKNKKGSGKMGARCSIMISHEK